MKIFEEAVEIAIANGWKYPVQIETLPTEFIMKDWKDYEITGKVYVLVGDIFGQGVVAVYMIGGISKEAIIMTKYGILKRKCDILNNDWQYLAIESLEAYLSSIEAALVKLEGLATGMNLQFLAQQAILRSKTYFLDDKKLSSLVEIYEKFQKSCSNVSNCDVYLPTDINPQALDVIKCQLGQPFDVFNYPNYDSCSFVQHLGLQMIKIEKDQEPVISPLKSKAIDMQKVIGSCKGIIKKQMDTLSHMELLKRYFLDPIRENYQRLGFTKEHLVSIQHPSVDSMIKCLRKFSIELGQNEDPGYVVKCFLANSAQLAKSTKDYSIAYASADLTKGIYGNGIELDRFIIECQNLMERETAQPLQYNDLRIKPVQYFVHMTMAMKEIFEYCDPAIQPLELLREGFIVSKNISEDNDKHVGNILRQTYMPRLISCISGLASLRTGNLLINSVEADEILTGKSGWLTLFSTCIVFIVEKPATRMFNTKLVFQLDEFSTSILDASGTNVILFKDEQLFNFTIKESQSRKDEFVKQMQHFAETCDTKVRDNRSDILCCNELETDFYFDIYSNASKIQRKKSDSAILVFDREPFDLMNLRGRYDNILLLMVSGKQTAKLAILSESDLMNSNEDLEFHENTIESCFYKLKTFLKQYSNKKSAKLGRLSYWDEMRLGGLIRLLIHGNDVFAMRNLVISRRSSVSYQVACLEGKAHGRAGSTLSRFSLISSKSKQTMESIMDHIAAPIRKLKGDTSSSIYTNEKPPSRSRKFASMMRSVLSTTSIDSINQIIEVLIKRKNEIEQFQKFKISPLHVNVIEDIASSIKKRKKDLKNTVKDLPLPILLASIQTFLAEDRQIFFDTTLRKDIIDLSSQFRTDQDLIPFLKHEIRNRVDKSQLKECKLFFGATKRLYEAYHDQESVLVQVREAMIPIFYPEGQLGWGEDTIESAENALEAIVFNYTVVLSNEDTSSFHSKPPSLNSSPSIRSISTIDSRINKLSNNPTIIKSGSASKSALFMNFKGENSTFSQQPATTKPPLASKPRIKPELSNHVLIHEPSYPSPEFILGPRVPVDEDSNVNPLPDAVSNDSSLVDELTVEQAGEKEFSELLMDKQDLLEDLSPKPVANMEDTGKQFLSDTIDGESLQNQVQSKVQVSTGTKEFAEHMFSSLTLHELFQPLKFDQNLLETLAKKAELTEDPLESLEVD